MKALRFRQNSHARLRLICFPSAGSGVSMLHTWFRDLSPEYEVCAVQAPGREDRHTERPFRSMTPLVEMAADALESALDRPYALFGHSLGALAAFETARELRRRGMPTPVRLLVSSRIAPQVPLRFSPIHHLPENQFIEQLGLRYGPVPPVILSDPDLMALFLPVLRSDIEIFETYQYSAEAPLELDISVLSGESDPMVDAAGLQAWGAQTTRALKIRALGVLP